MRLIHSCLLVAAVTVAMLLMPVVTPLGQLFAQEVVAEAVAEAPGVIDLGPLIDFGLEFAAILLAPFLLYVAVRWLKLKLSEQARQTLLSAMEKAVAFGVAKARDNLDDIGKIETRNRIVEAAVTYVIQATPDALRKFGIGPMGLRDRLLARTEEYLRYMPEMIALEGINDETVANDG